jgi:Tfp pilus assembly protein PilO
MGNFQLQKRIILTALAILLAVDVGLASYAFKMAEARQDPQKALAMENRQLGLLKADVTRAAEIQKRIPDVLKGFDEFEKGLPPASKGYSVISQEFGEYVRETHLRMEDVVFKQKELPGRNLDELDIVASVSGDYTGIVRFLNALQRSRKNVYIVDSLQVDIQNSVQGAPSALKINLHLRSYFRKA